MKIAELVNGQVVRSRVGRYSDWNSEPIWQPWGDFVLFVQKNKKNEITIISIGADDCEYSPSDFDHGVFECEGYYLEIEGLEK